MSIDIYRIARSGILTLFIGFILAVGCADTQPAPTPAAVASASPPSPEPAAEDDAVIWTSDPLVLRASKSYAPTAWQDAEVSATRRVAFAVPHEIPVLLGNSGNQAAELRFRTPEGDEVVCDYRGGSDLAHPDSTYEKAKASRYLFERCSNDLESGANVTGTWFYLHVENGDSEDPAHLTLVELRLGDSLQVLAPPISPEESVRIRDAFTWQQTSDLQEQNADGFPALYYTLVYVEEREQVEALNDMLVHYSTLPLFASELDRWQGQRGMFTHEGDGRGIFLFALMPGSVYNLIREAALEGNELYTAIDLREAPADAQLPDGSISYQSLRNSGFRFRDLGPEDVAEWNASNEGNSQQELFNALKRRIVKTIASVAKILVRSVVQGIGAVDRWATGSAELAVRLDVRNTDPRFGAGTPMQRAWGVGAGQPVILPGVRVSAWQRTLGGVVPTLFSAHTDETGVARLRVARGKETSFCIATENDAAEITRFLLETEVCDFTKAGGGQIRSNVTINVRVQHGYFNILAQASEGRSYLQDVVGYTPRKAEILVGRLANFASLFRDGVALTPCFGYPNLAYDKFVQRLSLAVAAVPLIGPAASAAIQLAGPAYAVDMIVAEDPVEGGGDNNFDSRGIVSHEYGHFTLCDMLYRQGVENITVGYTDAMLNAIQDGGDPPPDADAGYINEAFAEFISAQIAGGVNYIDANINIDTDRNIDCRDLSTACRSSLQMGYCLASSEGRCMDLNMNQLDSFDDQIARVATLLHDAFDGAPSLPQQNLPGNVDVWQLSNGRLVYSRQNRTGSADDETILLGGPSLRTLISKWNARGLLLTQDNFLGGLSDTMADAGFDWCSRCQLFALHDERRGTSTAEQICLQEPIASWLGPGNPSRTVLLQPGPEAKNAKVWSHPDHRDDSYGGSPILSAEAWTWSSVPGIRRSFFEFDLSSIPAGTQIRAARLTLHANTNVSISGHSTLSGPNNGYLWRVMSPWEESDVTWNHQPHVDFDSSTPIPISASTSSDQTYVLNVTDLVQSMVDDPATNYGFMLQLAEEQYYRALVFWSSEASDASVRPRLDVELEANCP
ncbi:DNRLRE domain-containing protein [Sorangium cellulosum]|uniref:DNRLRE domain-containing protein n=1 Tax=Sorangium cellulosum TaxID=56 RepID=UPI0004227AD1|nr:DNRLRE domain-containing protein [Sorangium cellulosum]